MDVRRVLATNLLALMDYARDNNTEEPQSQKALAKATKLGRATIKRMLDGDSGSAIDTVQLVAQAYNLSPWQILINGLEPSNPPVVLVSEAERQLQERLRQVSGDFLRHLKTAEAPRASRGADADRPRPAGRKAVRHKNDLDAPAQIPRKPKSLIRK